MGDNHRLPLLNIDNQFIWIEETKEIINEFEIVYMINPNSHVNKAFREKVGKCMNTTFAGLTQPFNKTTLSNKNTSVLSSLTFYETIILNPRKYFRV